MPFVNPGHMWLVMLLLVVVMIVWGPGKLPEVGAGMGRAIREFKNATQEMKGGVAQSNDISPSTSPAGEASNTAPAPLIGEEQRPIR